MHRLVSPCKGVVTCLQRPFDRLSPTAQQLLSNLRLHRRLKLALDIPQLRCPVEIFYQSGTQGCQGGRSQGRGLGDFGTRDRQVEHVGKKLA